MPIDPKASFFHAAAMEACRTVRYIMLVGRVDIRDVVSYRVVRCGSYNACSIRAPSTESDYFFINLKSSTRSPSGIAVVEREAA